VACLKILTCSFSARPAQMPWQCQRTRPSWPLVPMLPIAAISGTLGQVRSRPSSRVRSPRSLTGAVALRSQTGLTGSARPRTISQREHGHLPSSRTPACLYVNGGSGDLYYSRQPTGVRRRRSGSASGSCGETRRVGGASGPAGRLETVQKVLTEAQQPSSPETRKRCQARMLDTGR
jgi:hypothetical protein